jgi:RecA-family ATPase
MMAAGDDDGDQVIPLDEARRQQSNDWRYSENNRTAGGSKPLRFTTPMDWANKPEPPPTQFLWDGFLPLQEPCSMIAAPSAGKSFVSLQLMASAALGRPLFGRDVAPGRSLLISCEDKEAIIWSRLARIADHYGVTLGDFEDQIAIVDRSAARAGNIMFTVDRESWDIVETQLWNDVFATVELIKPVMVIIDGLSLVYDGPTHISSLAYKVIGKLVDLCESTGTTPIMIRHSSRAGQASGEGYSGTTAWEAAFRGVVYLDRPDAHAPERKIRSAKQNYASDDTEIDITWDDQEQVFSQVFDEYGAVANIEKKNERKRLVESIRVILDEGGFAALTRQSRHRYYVKQLQRTKEWRGVSADRIINIADDLLASGDLVIGYVRTPDRKQRESLLPSGWSQKLDDDDGRASS